MDAARVIEERAAGLPAPRVLEQATVVLSLGFGLPSQTVRIDEDDVDTDAAPERIAANKRLLAGSKEFKKVTKVRTAIKSWVSSIALSANMMGPGRALVPLALVERIEQKLARFRDEEWTPSVEEFVAAYPDLKVKAKLPKAEGGLGSLYAESDYPDAEIVRERCRFRWSYEPPPGAPASLERVSAEFFAEKRLEAEKAWTDAREEIAVGLREGLATLVSRMASVLKPGKDGRKKALRNSLVEEMVEFLDLLSARNIVGDAEVEKLAARARTIMAGVDAETLRVSDSVRERVQATMEELAEQVEQAVVTRRRAITWEDE